MRYFDKTFFKFLLTFLVLVSLSLVFIKYVSAEIFINEIMYDLNGTDTGREWVEVYNSGSDAVDISSWKFFENNTNHALNVVSGGTSIAAGGFAIITDNSTKFLEDWPSFSGIIFDSTFSLNNTGETLLLRNADLVNQDEVTYSSNTGANGDDNSLQRKSDGIWVAAIPTPGLSTAGSSSATTTVESDEEEDEMEITLSDDDSTHYSAAWLSTNKVTGTLEMSAGRDRVSVVGAPMEFKAETNFGFSRNNHFLWSFGDGSVGYGPEVVHVYEYPGNYAVVLNVDLADKRTAVSRLDAHITEPKLVITHASTERIEITNNGTSEVNLYGRALESHGGLFIFPRDTIVKGGEKISFSSHLTNLAPRDAGQVSIIITKPGMRVYEILAKIEREKTEKIAMITSQIDSLKQQLAQVPQDTPALTERQEDQVNIASSPSVETAAAVESLPEEEARTGWLATIKKFFLGSK